MIDYTKAELEEARRALVSTLHKCEKTQESPKLGAAQRTLLEQRIAALRISLALIEEKLERQALPGETAQPLLDNLNKLRTTPLGAERIRKNLSLDAPDVVAWCREKTAGAGSITQKGKNWYVHADNIVITINAHSYTIITAHKR